MKLVNNIEINNSAIGANIKKLISQIYKLLPNREENIDWQTPLTTIIEELAGMCILLPQYHSIVFALLCKYTVRLKGRATPEVPLFHNPAPQTAHTVLLRVTMQHYLPQDHPF